MAFMRLAVKTLKWLGLGIAGLCVLGFLYQIIGDALDAKYAPPRSDMIAVDGHAVHFACTGAGSRTYLLDAGAGVGAFEWAYIAPLLAKTGRVCAFDRPGLGWSDDIGQAHDVATLASQVAAIVRASKMPRPFIYVGHSLGANDAMIYQNEFPNDVSALILLEPGRPEDLREDFHGTPAAAMAATECGVTCIGAESLTWLGVSRLALRLISAGGHSLGPEMRGQYLAQMSRPAQVRTIMATLGALPQSSFELDGVKSFGNTPVLVITSSNPRKRDSDETEAAFRQWRIDELAYFASIVRLSSRGKGPVFIPDTTHATMVMSAAGAAAAAKAALDFLAVPPGRGTQSTR
jgi:pimeloyl-ACP methyl ester carboxylesterase